MHCHRLFDIHVWLSLGLLIINEHEPRPLQLKVALGNLSSNNAKLAKQFLVRDLIVVFVAVFPFISTTKIFTTKQPNEKTHLKIHDLDDLEQMS